MFNCHAVHIFICPTCLPGYKCDHKSYVDLGELSLLAPMLVLEMYSVDFGGVFIDLKKIKFSFDWAVLVSV